MRGDFSAGNDPVAKAAVPPVGESETPANEGFKPLGIGFAHGNGAGGLRLRLLALQISQASSQPSLLGPIFGTLAVSLQPRFLLVQLSVFQLEADWKVFQIRHASVHTKLYVHGNILRMG